MMNPLFLKTVFLFAVTGCSASIAQINFSDSNELAIAIKPLNRKQQDGKEKESLTINIERSAHPQAATEYSSLLPIQKIQQGPSIAKLPVVEAVKLPTWTISPSDKTVRQALLRWGQIAGYEVLWAVPRDLTVEAEAVFEGAFETAVKSVLESFENSDYPVEATVYANKVVRVVKTVKTNSKNSV